MTPAHRDDGSVLFGFLGAEFRLFPPDVHDGVAAAVADGSFERPMPAVFASLVRRIDGGVMLDIGANNGIYSVLACALHPGVTVEAFEPYPPVIRVLERTIAANAFGERIHLNRVALSDRSGETQLYVPDPGHGLLETSCSLNPDFQAFAGAVTVRTRRLDELDVGSPVLIKLDVEGHEPAVLAGARETILRARPILFVEVLRAADTRTVNALAGAGGFRCYKLHQEGRVVREDAIAFDLGAWNHVLVPEEKVGLFEAAVAAAEVPVT